MTGTARAATAAAGLACAFDACLKAFNVSATLLVLGLMVLICADVIGRGVFGAPIVGVPEIVSAVVPIMLWLQVAYTLRIGQHVRASIGLRLMGPGAARWVLVANAVAGLLLFGIIGYYAWGEFRLTWESGSWEGGGAVRIPDWPVWLAVALGATCTGIQFVRDTWRLVRHGPSDVDTIGAE